MTGSNAIDGRPHPPLRILIGEDELLVGTVLEDALLARGYDVVGLFGDLASLTKACRSLTFDIAILDVNLAGKLVFPLAEELRAHGKCFVFVTGYGNRLLPENLAQTPVVPKPCCIDHLERVMLAARERMAGAAHQPTRKAPVETLGDLLRASPGNAAPEAEWQVLRAGIATGAYGAFCALYDRANPLVYTLAFRITRDAARADEVTGSVFRDIWDSGLAEGPVLKTIMNLTRARAISFQQAHARPVSDGSCPLYPSVTLRDRLLNSLSGRGDEKSAVPAAQSFAPEWLTVANGIEYSRLAEDAASNEISMLVRMAPNTSYPAHTHAGVEELHLLEGELWIEDRLLHAGDYNYGWPGRTDRRVWSATGCVCFLHTSTQDALHLHGVDVQAH